MGGHITSLRQLTRPASRDIEFCGTGFTNGLNTNPWSALLSLEGSIPSIGFDDPELKKAGASGNVPVVGDGSDCFRPKRIFSFSELCIHFAVS
jgi:hypothetical protein